MKMTKKEYDKYVKTKMPKSKTGLNTIKAFVTGGLICCIGQALLNGYGKLGLPEDKAGTMTSITLILAAAILTGLKLYDNIAKFAGAGTLVPITGFSNAVTSAALEFKSEGLVTGMAAKMFIIAGPVIVYGTIAGVVYGVIYWITTLF